MPFLGYLLYPETTRLAKRSRRRYIQKIRDYTQRLEKGIWSQREYQSHVTPLTAFTQHADAKAFRMSVFQRMLE
ncbi:MAG: hypothetical protein IPJ00_16465 [Saprospirales bacterium]|nr:hypothetical protein [Saprospirales bacterium]